MLRGVGLLIYVILCILKIPSKKKVLIQVWALFNNSMKHDMKMKKNIEKKKEKIRGNDFSFSVPHPYLLIA